MVEIDPCCPKRMILSSVRVVYFLLLLGAGNVFFSGCLYFVLRGSDGGVLCIGMTDND